jgi:ABC-type polysaccharide/polyol phosphate transport system ATPase subunit
MVSIRVENAWVEFPVKLTRSPRLKRTVTHTGGQIDATRGVIDALRDINLDLREGDRLGLMGHNGAGKSTMLRLLAGAYTPTRGRVLSSGRISTLFSSTPGLSIEATGRENIITCGLYLGMGRREIVSKMDEISDFAELGDYIDLPVRIYSTGMLVRLGFAIATAIEPEILLLDEGLATGDAQFARKAEKKMHELIGRSSILVIASHSMSLLSSNVYYWNMDRFCSLVLPMTWPGAIKNL